MKWKKLCPNLSFTFKNKIVNLHKVGHISNFSSNFKNLSVKWDEYVFRREEWNFKRIENSAHTASVTTAKSTLLTKMCLKFQTPKFNVLFKIAFFFFI